MDRLTERNRDRCDLCAANYDGVCLLPNTFPCDDYKRYHRLAVIEDILGDDYDLDKLRVMMNQVQRVDGREMVRKMKNLSQIPENELIIVKYKEGMTEVIEAGEIESCIAYNEGFSLEFYTAVKDTLKIDAKTLITTLTEMLGDDQYEDWAEDMFYELIGEKETQEFVEAFNRAAENRASYSMGEAIDLAH